MSCATARSLRYSASSAASSRVSARPASRSGRRSHVRPSACLQPPAADLRMVPRQQHLGHRAAFVHLRPRVVRTIEQARRRTNPAPPTPRRSARPATAARSHRSASAPAVRRPTPRNRRSRSPRPTRCQQGARRCPRSAPPPTRIPRPPPPPARHPRMRERRRLPATGGSTRGAATPASACAAFAARIACASGPGSITIPGPPPYGRSSTVRWLSVAKSRGFHDPKRHSPRSRARPVTPNAAACSDHLRKQRHDIDAHALEPRSF